MNLGGGNTHAGSIPVVRTSRDGGGSPQKTMSNFDEAIVEGVYRLLLDEFPRDDTKVGPITPVRVWRDYHNWYRIRIDPMGSTPLSVSVLPPVMGLYHPNGQVANYELADPDCFDRLIADIKECSGLCFDNPTENRRNLQWGS